jgi:hypothetical protein
VEEKRIMVLNRPILGIWTIRLPQDPAIESLLGRLVLTCCGAEFSDLDESVAAAVAR